MFYHTRSGGAVNLHNVAIEIKDLCRHLVDKGHRPAHLVLIFKDVGNILQSKKDTKVIALWICNKDCSKIDWMHLKWERVDKTGH